MNILISGEPPFPGVRKVARRTTNTRSSQKTTPLLSHTTNQDIIAGYNEWKKSIVSGLEPQTIADCVTFAYNQPQDVCVREIVIAKTKQDN